MGAGGHQPGGDKRDDGGRSGGGRRRGGGVMKGTKRKTSGPGHKEIIQVAN